MGKDAVGWLEAVRNCRDDAYDYRELLEDYQRWVMDTDTSEKEQDRGRNDRTGEYVQVMECVMGIESLDIV